MNNPEDGRSGSTIWPPAGGYVPLSGGPIVDPGLRLLGLFLFYLVESKNIYLVVK